MEELVLPPALEKGDKVAVIATSAGVKNRFPGCFEKGIERLENRFELETEVYPNAERGTEYLNAHPEEKAEDLMKAFEDPDIKGVIPVTGGDEELRILRYLEPERLKENPTRFYGISDNTNIHVYLWNLGIQSFYGGQFMTDLLSEGKLGEYTYSYLDKAFFEDSIGLVEPSEVFTDESLDISDGEIRDKRKRYRANGYEYWNFNGNVEGRLFGGCAEIIYWQLATGKYIPEHEELEGSILALETSEEAPSANEIKRWLMCMGENGFLQNFSALIVGRPRRESPHEDKTEREKKQYHKDQKKMIKKEMKNYAPETPIVFDVDFGHTDPKVALQLGSKLEIRPEKQEIEFI